MQGQGRGMSPRDNSDIKQKTLRNCMHKHTTGM